MLNKLINNNFKSKSMIQKKVYFNKNKFIEIKNFIYNLQPLKTILISKNNSIKDILNFLTFEN